MRTRWSLLALAAVIAATSTAATPNVAHRRMFPALVIFRGGGLQEPVGLQNCCATIVNINGRSGASIDQDTLALLYQGLSPAIEIHPETLDTSNHFEVAEFFGGSPLMTTGRESVAVLHRPDLKSLFAQANHTSWIYRGKGSQPPIWEQPVVAPGGANEQYYKISPAGEKILTSLGLKLR